MTDEDLITGNSIKNSINIIDEAITSISAPDLVTPSSLFDALYARYKVDYQQLQDTDTINALGVEIENFRDAYVGVLQDSKSVLQAQFNLLGANRENQ